jgi:hypothetical protein
MRALGFLRIVLREFRRQLPEDKFLQQIGEGTSANSDRRIFEG